MSRVPQALDGLKVVEFGGYAAGPHAGKLLANFGATVVHVESRDRPDGFRLEYPPFKDGIPGVDRGGCFSYFNDSKLSASLNVKRPEGAELARRLVDWCDVVIENMRPGVMARLGLGYDACAAINPGVVMLSTCNMGQTGPRAHTPGFGSQLSALAGFCGLTGTQGELPMLLYGPYIDFVASTLGAAAILAALERRRRTGRGAWIDLSQYECGLHFVAGALLDFHETGAVAEPAGNSDPIAAPHGVYACRDGSWLALSCWDDEEFRRMADAIGRADLVTSPRFADRDARRRNVDDLDAAIGAWCAEHLAAAAAGTLQHAGVHAHEVNSIADLFGDPQLHHRRLWRVRRHPVIGEQAFNFPGFDLSRTPGDVTGAGPRLGADNEVVFRELLGVGREEYEEYRRTNVID